MPHHRKDNATHKFTFNRTIDEEYTIEADSLDDAVHAAFAPGANWYLTGTEDEIDLAIDNDEPQTLGHRDIDDILLTD